MPRRETIGDLAPKEVGRKARSRGRVERDSAISHLIGMRHTRKLHRTFGPAFLTVILFSWAYFLVQPGNLSQEV